ncbi:MAG TPA: methyl-accepting chemotaxis protein [Dissulfurispiraceae bacterium]|nr:methyl-accepting chemotaxis protein [Dissulfurispiraceae bacterium]
MNIKKLLLAVGIANAIVLGLIMTLFVVYNGGIKDRTERMIKIDQALLLDLTDMYANGLQSGQATRNILINPTDENAKKNYRDALEGFVKENDEAVKLSSGKMQEGLRDIKTLYEEDNKLKAEVQELAVSGKKDEAIALLNGAETPKWRVVRSSLLGMMKEQKGTFSNSLQENEKAMRRGTMLLIVIILLSFIAFSAFIYVINKTIQKNMASAFDCFTTIEKGELKEECKIIDESNFLKDIYNKILMSLRETVVNISRVAKGVTQDVSSLSEGVNNIDARAKEQLAQIDRIASATAEMTQTILDVAKNASYASEMARGATDIADKGKDTVKKAVDAIMGISDSVRESSNTIGELGRSSQEIGEIVAVINDIADQTNLLALNAAIEAARAGEQGRGFAVVADEVRKLAERSSKATGEIAEKIKAIQMKSEASVESMVKSTKNAEGGVTLAGEAASALDEIVVATQKAMDMIQRIAAATEEQSSTSEEISQNMDNITENLNSTVAMINDAKVIMDRLHSQADDLDRSISWFKV